MGYFDELDFDDTSKNSKKNKEELIEALLRNTEQTIAELDLEAIDDIINYLLGRQSMQKQQDQRDGKNFIHRHLHSVRSMLNNSYL